MPQRPVRARARSVIAAGSGPSRAVHARVTLFCSLLHTKGVLYLGVRGCTCRLEMESLPLTSGKLVPFLLLYGIARLSCHAPSGCRRQTSFSAPSAPPANEYARAIRLAAATCFLGIMSGVPSQRYKLHYLSLACLMHFVGNYEHRCD